MNTDVEWEKWGQNDPYYGVITQEKFRKRNLTKEAKREFFESGRRHVDYVLEICRRHFDQRFSPGRVLDFGCGTGRLVIPFADTADHVVGLDVSTSMLREARGNCDEYSVKNVELHISDDDLSNLNGRFDLIHSFIVFQHIPVERGRHIFRRLLNHLEDGGICAIHVTYAKSIFPQSYGAPPVESSNSDARKQGGHAGRLLACFVQSAKQIIKSIRRSIRSDRKSKPLGKDPEMQMNSYSMNELFFMMQSSGIHRSYVDFTDHGGELGVYLFFQKPIMA